MVANFQLEAHTQKKARAFNDLFQANQITGRLAVLVLPLMFAGIRAINLMGGKTNFLSFSLIAQRLRPFVRGRTEIEAAHAPSYTENSDMRRETGDAMKDIQSTRKRAH